MRSLKILHLASHNSIQAGGSIQMARLAMDLKERGHDVTCAFNLKRRDPTPGLGTFGPLRKAGIPVHSFPMQRIAKFRGMLGLRRLLSSRRFDVVHCHRFRALRFACRAFAGHKVPALLGNKVNGYAVPPGWKAVYGSPKVDRIHINAEHLRGLLLETGRVPADKILLIYNGVDLDVFHPDVDGSGFREEQGVPATAPLIGMVANFDRKKSHAIFFDAAELVLRKVSEARFLLVGRGDSVPYRAKLDRKGVGGAFLFSGFVADVERAIAALDISVISSKEGEGQTVSLVESMAMAKPVVSTDVAGNPEFVMDRDTGMLVPRGDPEALAEAMLWLLENPDEAQAIGDRARAFVKDRVDTRLVTSRFEEAYYGILQEKNIGPDL